MRSNISENESVLKRIREQNLTENSLAIEAEQGRWSRRKTQFQTLTSADIEDFPEMTEEDLKIFFTGTYQLQQAISYLAEMLGDNDVLQIHYLKESHDIIKVRVRSRHINKKTYNCYIQYRPNTIGYGGVSRYCCECANGLRTIGCCSHVAAVIYYLSHGRYLSKIIRPAEKLMKIFQETDTVATINSDSEDED